MGKTIRQSLEAGKWRILRSLLPQPHAYIIVVTLKYLVKDGKRPFVNRKNFIVHTSRIPLHFMIGKKSNMRLEFDDGLLTEGFVRLLAPSLNDGSDEDVNVSERKLKRR